MTRTDAQLEVISEIVDLLAAAGLSWWLFGGWGMDALIGRVTREHSDIEFWIEIGDAELVRAALERRGFQAVGNQPPEESQEFERDGVCFSSAFFVRADDGFAHPEGRWSDWRFPPGSFSDGTGTLAGRSVPVMSVEGMLAMKEQYATLRNGRPLRDKDVRDLVALRQLLAR